MNLNDQENRRNSRRKGNTSLFPRIPKKRNHADEGRSRSRLTAHQTKKTYLATKPGRRSLKRKHSGYQSLQAPDVHLTKGDKTIRKKRRTGAGRTRPSLRTRQTRKKKRSQARERGSFEPKEWGTKNNAGLNIENRRLRRPEPQKGPVSCSASGKEN